MTEGTASNHSRKDLAVSGYTASIQTESPKERPVDLQTMVRRFLGPFAFLIHILKKVPYIGFGKAAEFEKVVYDMEKGTDILEWWSEQLTIDISVEGLENLPSKGAVILCCNHPTGLTDGIAVWDAIKTKRTDFKIMLNPNGLGQLPAFHDLVVPVYLGKGGKTSNNRETWRKIIDTLEAEKVMMACPAGRLSQLDWFGDWDIHDLPWKNSIEKMAQSFPEATFVPVCLEGRLRKRYYLLHKLFPAIRNVLLYTEFHSRKNWAMDVKILPPVTAFRARDVQRLVESKRTQKWFQRPIKNNNKGTNEQTDI